MGHYGKHIIDPETGLCEICDKGAIHEVRQGKQPGKQVYYSNHDDGFTPRSHHDETPRYGKDRYVYEMNDEPTPRYIRKSVYPQPTVQPRRVIYEQPIEEPVVVRRKIIRRARTPPPPEDVIIHRPHPRQKAFYYVDREGQMLPQNNTPPPEPPRRYIVQSMHPPPPARTVRVVRRHAQTPPPPATEVWHSGPRRQINSDTEIIERHHRMRRDETYHQTPPPTPPPPPPPLKRPEMYHLETVPDPNYYSPINSPIPMSHDNHTPPPKVIHQGNRNRNQRRIEPIEQTNHIEPEPTVVRRVYKKLPPGKYEPPNDEYNPQSLRKNDKNRLPPRQYVSSPQLTNRNNNRSPDLNGRPSIYFMRNHNDPQ